MSAALLVIEDNPDNLELMTCLLRAYGYDVESANDGREGIGKALSKDFDLILCDLAMPVMTGFEMIAELRQRQGQQHHRIVAITAYAMVGDREKVLTAGFDGYLTKPIAAETFVQQVEAFLPEDKRSSGVQHFYANSPEAAPNQQPVRGSVLVADDSPVNLELLRSMLEPNGYQTVVVSSVSAAMKEALAHSFDLIMSDLHMPKQDGLEFLRLAKENPATRDVPFIVFTSSLGESTPDAENLAMSLGADKFLRRPIDPSWVLAEVEECLASRRAP